MRKNDPSVNGHYNPVKAKENGWPIRLSKSSFMTYLQCPRKYWWQKVEMEGIRTPPTEYMIHGTAVHKSLENLYANLERIEEIDVLQAQDMRLLFDKDPEDSDYEPYVHEAVDVLAGLEHARLKEWGLEAFKPIEFEVKHEVVDPEHGVVLVGMIDGLLRHPVTGDLVIVELKTGKLGKAKQTKTRKELCYYAHMLELLGYGKTSHFMYLYPECTNEEIVLDLLDKEAKNKELSVWLGESQGVAYIEKVHGRSINAFKKSLGEAVQGLKNHNWDMNWNDWFCPQWCDFHMSCESEIMDAGWNINEHRSDNDGTTDGW
jgi:CRISPR/Cas system-associated exonuclease Cas4 (RecB family)